MRRSLFLIALLSCHCCGPAPTYGADLILSDDFNSGTVSASWSEALTKQTENYDPNTAQQPFATHPTNGTTALHYFVMSGTNERTPVQIGFTEGDDALCTAFGGTCPSELFFEWTENFDADVDGGGADTAYPFASSSQKLLRMFYQKGGQPESRKEYNWQPSTSTGEMTISAFCGEIFGDPTNCNVDFGDSSEEAYTRGVTTKWGAYLKLNTPGVSDGIQRLYKDCESGDYTECEPYIDHSNANLRGTDTRGINGLWIGGNHSGSNLPNDGHRYIDDVKIYNGLPDGGSGGGGEPVGAGGAVKARRGK